MGRESSSSVYGLSSSCVAGSFGGGCPREELKGSGASGEGATTTLGAGKHGLSDPSRLCFGWLPGTTLPCIRRVM